MMDVHYARAYIVCTLWIIDADLGRRGLEAHVRVQAFSHEATDERAEHAVRHAERECMYTST